jgi:polysaccharide pyruvyl transferase WcaK-like protein
LNVLCDNGDYDLANLGDTAMFVTAVRRIRKFCPAAKISALTRNPERLKYYCADVQPLVLDCAHAWWGWPALFPISRRWIPEGIYSYLNALDTSAKRNIPVLCNSLMRISSRIRPHRQDLIERYFHALTAADLVILTGCGFLTDAFASNAVRILYFFQLAKSLGKRTAMFSQGLGPLRDRSIREVARKTLAELDFLALREKLNGPRLLSSLGVSTDGVAVTGDDALEIALCCEHRDPRDALGVNLRVAQYALVAAPHIAMARRSIVRFLKSVRASAIPVPISTPPNIDDWQEIGRAFENTGVLRNVGRPLDVYGLIQLINRCRVVCTGSYHAAVFALALGIPTVALATNDYYKWKFLGLAEMFNVGLGMVMLSESQPESCIYDELHRAWDSSKALSPRLVKSAREQVALQNQTYTKFFGNCLGMCQAAECCR